MKSTEYALTLSEDQLLSTVLDMCARLDLHVMHPRPALAKSGRWMTAVQGNHANGFPDCVIAGDRGVLFRELKATSGRLRPDQRAWLERLNKAGQDAAVWFPADLVDGRIRRELGA